MFCKETYCKPVNAEQKQVYAEFQSFVRFKMKFCLFLTIVVLGCYFSFLILVGFFPNFLAISVGDSPVTLGIIFGICSILLGVVATGIYSFIVNFFLDSKERELIQKMKKVKIIEEETQ